VICMIWEKVSRCAFCRGTDFNLFLWKLDGWYNGQLLQLKECNNCRLVFADPRPTFEWYIERVKPSEKMLYERKLNRPNVMSIHKTIVKRAIKFAKHPKTLFDVGTGAGTLLIAAKQLGLEVEGNEINGYACEQLSKKGFRVFHLPTCNLNIDKTYNIITCLDYVEHSYTPIEDLFWIYNHQEYGGILYLKTLFLGCPDHQKEGPNWKLFAEGHIYFYWPDVLLRIIHEVGYETMYLHTTNATIHVVARKVR